MGSLEAVETAPHGAGTSLLAGPQLCAQGTRVPNVSVRARAAAPGRPARGAGGARGDPDSAADWPARSGQGFLRVKIFPFQRPNFPARSELSSAAFPPGLWRLSLRLEVRARAALWKHSASPLKTCPRRPVTRDQSKRTATGGKKPPVSRSEVTPHPGQSPHWRRPVPPGQGLEGDAGGWLGTWKAACRSSLRPHGLCSLPVSRWWRTACDRRRPASGASVPQHGTERSVSRDRRLRAQRKAHPPSPGAL